MPPGEKVAEHMQETVYKVEITFWEPDAGEFFFITSELETMLIIRENPLQTHVTLLLPSY